MTCHYQSREKSTGAFSCALGMYGGKPYLRNCEECISNGENNSAFADGLRQSSEKSHPASMPPIHGCCDPPPQVLTSRDV